MKPVTFPGSVTQVATVSPQGFVTSVKDELNNTTTYGYDALGRMTSLTHPIGDTVSWAGTTITYAKVATTERTRAADFSLRAMMDGYAAYLQAAVLERVQ